VAKPPLLSDSDHDSYVLEKQNTCHKQLKDSL